MAAFSCEHLYLPRPRPPKTEGAQACPHPPESPFSWARPEVLSGQGELGGESGHHRLACGEGGVGRGSKPPPSGSPLSFTDLGL